MVDQRVAVPSSILCLECLLTCAAVSMGRQVAEPRSHSHVRCDEKSEVWDRQAALPSSVLHAPVS